mmetsp:Transcript_9960/g.16038  ORF Transcript_9960/g.16038 Transcript_9960/m.16038 type:complete len:110 (-) Transcript_9960:134-463(-)
MMISSSVVAVATKLGQCNHHLTLRRIVRHRQHSLQQHRPRKLAKRIGGPKAELLRSETGKMPQKADFKILSSSRVSNVYARLVELHHCYSQKLIYKVWPSDILATCEET